MAEINPQTSARHVAEVSWDKSKYEGEVTIVATNPATGVSSNKSGPNDGSMTFTYSEGHSGNTEFRISDEFGNEEVIDAVVEDGVVVSSAQREVVSEEPQNSTSGETEETAETVETEGANENEEEADNE